MTTLGLNHEKWDIFLDNNGDIDVIKGNSDKEIVQNVCTACSLWRNDAYFEQDSGIPYKNDIMGSLPAPGFIRAELERAAMGVVGVVSARVTIDQYLGRGVIGTIELRTVNGNVLNVGI